MTAEQQALELFAAGASVAAVKEDLAARGLPGREVRRAVDAALAELIEALPTGEVERWLTEASRKDGGMLPAQRRKHEAKLAQVLCAYETLMDDEESTTAQVLGAAKTLDKLLSLGWAKQLPRGAFG